jgi:nucleotide-binding universal stress UspA family protein
LTSVSDALRVLGARPEASSVSTSLQVARGTPANELCALLQAEDLVVMTSRGSGGIQRWLLGSVAEKLIRSGVAPVLLIPALDRPELVEA